MSPCTWWKGLLVEDAAQNKRKIGLDAESAFKPLIEPSVGRRSSLLTPPQYVCQAHARLTTKECAPETGQPASSYVQKAVFSRE